MPTFKLTLEYDGTNYHGWQVQPNLPTVQGTLETVISRVAQHKAHVTSAGRTDAGVHALAQVAHFSTTAKLTAEEWLRALNGLLPPDIAVQALEEVPDTFHARYSAKSKLYRYRIFARVQRSALSQSKILHYPYPLDLEAMEVACRALVGTHDFTSFQGAQTDNENPVCSVTRLTVDRFGDEVIFEAEANRFLKQMVRNIVGTLLEVGRGKLQAGEIAGILAAKDRTKAGPTAPAHGLYLVKVDY
ncbi:MAG: tRNA pseudouridine(38-40) synthase TruA [Nitrospirae bacterium]|nr:MAG: tRNA pseudouridine(38-40) synthase TruA [Nitrospirota bacterium]